MNIYKRDISQSAETSGTATMEENKGKAQLKPGWREQEDGLVGDIVPEGLGRGLALKDPEGRQGSL